MSKPSLLCPSRVCSPGFAPNEIAPRNLDFVVPHFQVGLKFSTKNIQKQGLTSLDKSYSSFHSMIIVISVDRLGWEAISCWQKKMGWCAYHLPSGNQTWQCPLINRVLMENVSIDGRCFIAMLPVGIIFDLGCLMRLSSQPTSTNRAEITSMLTRGPTKLAVWRKLIDNDQH